MDTVRAVIFGLVLGLCFSGVGLLIDRKEATKP